MLRRLLACLALLTGLAAAGAPAQAEVAVTMASRIEASAAGCQAARSQVQAAAVQPALRHEFVDDGRAEPLRKPALAVPAIQLGSDRARE